MNTRQINRNFSSTERISRSKVAAILLCAVAAPAMATDFANIAAMIAAGPTNPVTLDSTPVVDSIASQGAGYQLTIGGVTRTYNNWALIASDGTGSVEIFGAMPSGYVPQLGDTVGSLGGQYALFNGIPELENLTSISKVGSGATVPDPVVTTIPDLNAIGTAPNYNLSEYVLKLEDVTLSGAFGANPNSNGTLTATDKNNKSITVFQWATSYSKAGQLSGTSIPNNGNDVDITGIVDAFTSGTTTTAEFIPFSVVASPEATTPPPNNSTLTLTASQPTGVVFVDSKNATVHVGTQVNLGSDGLNGDAPQNLVYAMLKGGTASANVQLQANSGVQTDTTTYEVVPGATNPAHGGRVGTAAFPLPAGQTDSTPVVGYNTADAGTPGAMTNGGNVGTLQFVNQSNTSDTPINVTMNSVKVLESRNLDGATSKNGVYMGNILVGKSATGSGVSLTSTNTDTSNDFSSNTLTDVTLLANSTSTPFTQNDPFTGNGVANIVATAPAYDQVFGGPSQGVSGAFNNVGTSTAPLPGTTQESGTASLTVAPIISGTYGDSHMATIGSTTKTYSANFTSFAGTANGVVGMNLPGESDAIFVYAQYTGWQTAKVAGNTSPVPAGGTVTLTNAATDDNIATVGGVTGNFGVRDAAWITSVGFNQDGWSQNNFSAATSGSGGSDNPGTIISGTQFTVLDGESQSDTSPHSQSTTLSYNPTLALAGSYTGGSMLVGLENGQVDTNDVIDGNAILGTSHNDLAPVLVPVANETGTGDGSGTYNFGGGTFTAASSVTLNGSFTQTGGTSIFGNINGTGSISVMGGTLKITAGHNTIGSLAVSGTGLVDLMDTDLTVSTASLSTVTALIAQAYDNGKWDGVTGITSSTAASTPGTGIGVNASGGGVSMMLTWYGDTDLTGTVTNTDLQNMKPGMANPTWANGDFNYDGAVNADDFGLAMLGAAESAGRNINVVAPEPAVLSAFVLPAILGLRRRRHA